MSSTVAGLRVSSRYRLRSARKQAILHPVNLKELQHILGPDSPHHPPFRPMGAASAVTDCNRSSVGTVVDMTSFDRIISIQKIGGQVTVQAGVSLLRLSRALEACGLELDGSHGLMNRTVGGAVAGTCGGPAIGIDHGLFAAQVISMKLVSPTGGLLNIGSGQDSLLNVFRLSYGMLGIIYELTLRTRTIRRFTATHRRCSLKQFTNAIDSLVRTEIGIQFSLLPFADIVYLDLRRFSTGTPTSSRLPWKIKHWSENSMLPSVFKMLNRLIPVTGIRYRLIDGLGKLTQRFVSTRLVSTGSVATTQPCSIDTSKALLSSTWFFPAADFSIVVQAYKEFCLRVWHDSDFRCDMPTVGYYLSRDQSALLSPSFDESMIALCSTSTQSKGWDNFAIDFGEFARHWGGTAAFDQTREIERVHAGEILGDRLELFRRVRRQIDPEQRMMNPYLSQYFL